MPHCECASGKMHHPIHLFLCVSHTFPLARMRLRAPTPRAHSPLSLEGFSHFSKCACCGAIACCPFTRCAGAIFLLRALSVFGFFYLQIEKLRC